MTETVISSSVLIFVVILLRTVFKGKIKNRVRYALWLIVAVRLLLPFSLIESSVSVMNFFGKAELSEKVEKDDVTSETRYLPSPENDGTANYDIPESDAYGDEWEIRRSEYVPQETTSAPEIPAVRSSPAKRLSVSAVVKIVRRLC